MHEQIGSTNDRLRDLVRAGAPAWQVVLADEQVGGRGRLGRAWYQPPRSSLISSVSMPLSSLAHAGWVPLVAGLALAEAIDELEAPAGPAQPRAGAVLKWPNDVLLTGDGGRKVAGILCELVLPAAGQEPREPHVIIGCGVNVTLARDELPVPTATSLALAGLPLEREALAVAYLFHLRHRLEQLDTQAGWQAVAQAYRARCVTIGEQVEVHAAEAVQLGTAEGVDDEGRLSVRHLDGRLVSHAAADVVHVRRPGGALA